MTYQNELYDGDIKKLYRYKSNIK